MIAGKRTGFNVMELLIVALVSSLLALIVVQHFGSVSDERSKNRVAEFNLATLRSAIRSYRREHHGQLPMHADGTLAGLTSKTRADGTIDEAGQYGPYVSEIGENPFQGSCVVKATSATGSTISAHDLTLDAGWLYNPETGEIFLNSTSGLGL